VIEGPEECDDGNTLDGDCCASTCQYEALAAPCDADTDACTQDQCDGNGSCVFVAENPELCIDHVLCYKTTSLVPFSRRTVSLVDQLETADADVVRPRSLCLPASKNGGAVLDPVTHAEEYRIKSALAHVRRRGVVVTDQFGTLTVDTVKAERLLVPTNKSLMGPATPPSPGVADHYKCYKVKVRAPKFPKGIQATVADQFEDRLYDVKKPRHLCVPASKDGEPLVHPVAHLMCYEVKRAREEPKHVRRFGVQVANQFGAETLDSVREETLCVPALKTLP
jgi:cysteine-rich repeat protein